MQRTIKGRLESFKNNRKKIFESDFPELWDRLNIMENQINSIINDDSFKREIQSAVNNTTQANKNIEISDELLSICSEFTIIDSLEEDEYSFLNGLYKKRYSAFIESKQQHNHRFPGCGEKNKNENTEGDFIIYHEMIKFMKENQTSCIFLTNDITKKDWLQENKRPFVHYIENTYLLTQQVMLISHVEFSLGKINFENVHKQNENDTNEVYSDTEKRSSSYLNYLFDRGLINVGDRVIYQPALKEEVNTELVTALIIKKGGHCLQTSLFPDEDFSFSRLRRILLNC